MISTLRDLRTKFEGDKNLTVNLFDYVRAMRELGDHINYIKRETLKKETDQNDRNEATGQQPTIYPRLDNPFRKGDPPLNPARSFTSRTFQKLLESNLTATGSSLSTA